MGLLTSIIRVRKNAEIIFILLILRLSIFESEDLESSMMLNFDNSSFKYMKKQVDDLNGRKSSFKEC